MGLVDSSVWVDHLRASSPRLCRLLDGEQVAAHPFGFGELACGNLKIRKEILALLRSLPAVARVEDDEILLFIEAHALAGKGLGLIDAHLLASSQMSGHPLWTKDRRLGSAAQDLGLDFVRQG